MTASTTFTWTINTLERLTATGEIQTIHYSVDASDDQYRSGAYGSIGLDPADPADMVPYADVTQEQCIEWLKAKLGEEAVTNVETALQGQLDEQRSPSKAQGVPWAA